MLKYIQFTFLVIVFTFGYFVVSASETSDIDEPEGNPLSGQEIRITSGLGDRHDPFTGELKFHSGVDMAAPAGTEVVATMSGEVIKAGKVGLRGNTVIISNQSGYEIRYSQLQEIMVRQGETVTHGRVIGTVGQSGRATAPHLHYEVRKGDSVLNPADTFELE